MRVRTTVLPSALLALLVSATASPAQVGNPTIQFGVSTSSPVQTPPPSAAVPQLPELSVAINFDDVAAPCSFQTANPLRNQYAGLGVTFTGPSATNGGAVLNERANFSVTGNSSPNFVAFNSSSTSTMQNGGRPVGPERIDFAPPVVQVQVRVAGPSGGTVTVSAYSAADVQLTSASLELTNSMRSLVVSSPGIAYAVLSVQPGDVGEALKVTYR